MAETRSQRNSGIELLRIISMCIIVLHHFSVHGGFAYETTQLSVNRLWTQFISLGSVGVNIFILISGYFLIDSKGVKLEKLVKLWLQMFFYSTVLYLLLCVFGKAAFSPSTLLSACFPFIGKKWWFASAYMLLYLMHPFLNQFIRTASKRMYLSCLAVMTVLWCVIPTFTNNPVGSNDLIWLVYVYLLASWIKKYCHIKAESRRRIVLVGVAALLLLFLSTVVIDVVGLKIAAIGRVGTLFYLKHSLLVVVLALCFFLYAISCKPFYSRTVNFVAKTTSGIYLIHCYDPVKDYVWFDLFHNAAHAESPTLIPYSLFAAAVVLLAAFGIEAGRLTLEKKYVDPLLKEPVGRLEAKLTAAFQRLA